MPLRLQIKRRLTAKSERVKSVEIHQSEPWMLTSLYNGQAYIWNMETKQILKTIQVSDAPVRVAKFIARKNWIVTGSDDTFIRVFNYNTLEHVTQVAAHLDYIRTLAVHPSRPFVLSAGDDGVIKLWNWEKKWACTQMFQGHTYFIMMVVINPKDNNQFASASLDRSVKVWQFGSAVPNFSLKHEKDVNCVDYHPGGDKPYLVTGEDGGTVRIWDYQTKSCVQSLQVHSNDVNTVIFHPSLPIILSGGSDGTIRVYHSSTYRLENTLNYGLERVWSIACQRNSNNVAIGFDEGSMVIRLGQEEPAMSMDSSGKIIWAKHSEIQQANIKAMGDQEIKDGERLSLAVKDMGSCEIYPQTVSHSPNGRFAAVCGDGEYIIYTAMALRSKSFGSAQEFVWSSDSSVYAIREGSSLLKVFKNFKEHKSFKPSFGVDGICGGHLMGVKTSNSLSFYDWDSTNLIRRIEISAKNVFWNDDGELVAIVTEDSFYILKYKADAVESGVEATEDGYEDAFEVVKEVEDSVRTGLWVGDCFIYTNSVNRLNYYVGGEIVTIAHLDRVMYLLGYIPKDNRLYLGDKQLNIVSYSLLVSVLEYQTAVMRRDFDTADKVLPTVPREQRSRVAYFLQKQGFTSQALAVTMDPDHKFDLAIELKDLKVAYNLAKQYNDAEKWKQLSELAIQFSEFGLAQECLHRFKDYGGLMLLATSAGHREVMTKLAHGAVEAGQNNVGFTASFVLGRIEDCLEILIKTNRIPEAALFARTYLPSQLSRVVTLWKEQAAKESKRLSNAFADPAEYENLFPGLKDMVKTEKYLQQQRQVTIPAAAYPKVPTSRERNAVAEMQLAEASGRYVFEEEQTRDIGDGLDDKDDDSNEDEEDDDGFVKVHATKHIKKATPKPFPGTSGHSHISSSIQNSTNPVPSVSLPTKTEERQQPSNHPAATNAGSSGAGKQLSENGAQQQQTVENEAKSSPSHKSIEELEKELELDLENVNIDDFDMADLDLDEEGLLND